MTRSAGLWLLLPFCLTLFLRGLDANDLWSAHEARAAQNAQCMIDEGNWGLPRLYDGQVELQKPPAFYWLVAGAAGLEGGRVDRWAVRLPSAIAAILTVGALWHWLSARGRPLAGLIAATVLASTIHFTSLARTGRIDMPLTFAISMILFTVAPPAGGGRLSYSWPRHILAGLMFALAILLKGPIGVVLSVVVLAAWPLAGRAFSHFSPSIESGGAAQALRLAASVLLGAAIALPWFIWVNRQTDGEFVRVFFWYHNVERAIGDAPALASYPWWYYVPRLGLDFLPWTPLLLLALVGERKLWSGQGDRTAQFGLCWLTTMLVLLSLASFKRADYLLPAFPGAAIFVGCVCEKWYIEQSAARKRFAQAFLLLMTTGLVGGWWWFHHSIEPKQGAVREQQAFADYIRRQAPPPAEVLLFRVESHLLAFHLGRPLHTLVEWSELNTRLAQPGSHWIVTRAEFLPECWEMVHSRRIQLDARNQDFCTAPPHRPLVLLRTIDEQAICPPRD